MRTNLFIPRRFGATNTKFDTRCLRYVATCGKKNFIYVHITILGPKLLHLNFLQISQLSIRSGAHKLLRRFLDFSQFLTAISRKLWRHLATKMRTVVHLKEQSIVEKALKTASKSNHKPSHNTLLNYVPHAQADQVTYKKHQFSLLQLARVVRSPPNFAC